MSICKINANDVREMSHFQIIQKMYFVWLFMLVYVECAPWTESNAPYNLNQNRTAKDPIYYSADWNGHVYFPSPANWRFPFYTIMVDRFYDSNPINNDIDGTMFEYDPMQIHFRHGGDVKGLLNQLDYLETLGIKGIYIAGTPFINQPWDYHGYNPHDYTLLDPHLGTLVEWRQAIEEIHRRGFYVIIDLTITTLGDLLAFEGHVNASVPFDLNGYPVLYKTSKTYPDFTVNNTIDPSCTLPTLYNETGYPITVSLPNGCSFSDFDQFGDVEAFGIFPPWQRQLSKFAGVQDRLKEWKKELQPKLVSLACLTIASLDIDGIRIDKATQITLDFLASVWSPGVRQCATQFGKANFFLPGEITTRVDYAGLYVGRGLQPHKRPSPTQNIISSHSDDSLMRKSVSVDSSAFHYSLYRTLVSFLGLYGNIDSDLSLDFVKVWKQLTLSFDFTNSVTGVFDPRDMYGVTNQDTFRWPSIQYGRERLRLGLFLFTLALPGIPLLYYGEEQDLYLHDSRSENYVFGRQPMSASVGWQAHGCYKGNASYQYFNMPFERIRNGCKDDNQSKDHFDTSSPHFIFVKHLYQLRRDFPILQDGFLFESLSSNTWNVSVDAGKYITNQTTVGLWSAYRSYLPEQQDSFLVEKVWLLYSNVDRQTNWNFVDCNSPYAIKSPYPVNSIVRNIFPPFETYRLSGTAAVSCIPRLNMDPFMFKAFVLQSEWKSPQPMIVGFKPGHDSRILRADSTMSIPLEFYFSNSMNCDSVTLSIQLSSGSVNADTIHCTDEAYNMESYLPAVWVWKGLWTGFLDGVQEIKIGKNAKTQANDAVISSDSAFIVRVGASDNVIVFPQNKIGNPNSIIKVSENLYELHHKADGANLFRYSGDYGRSWTLWKAYESKTTLPSSVFNQGKRHLIVSYWCHGSAAHRIHIDLDESEMSFYPSVHVRGDFNTFGHDSGINDQMKRSNGLWEFPFMWHFPAKIYLDIWGDESVYFGDIDSDKILDRLPPDAQDPLYLQIEAPPKDYLGWTLKLNDRTLEWSLEPRGSWTVGLVIFLLLAILPLSAGIIAVNCYKFFTYKIIENKVGRIHVERRSRWESRSTSLTRTVQNDNGNTLSDSTHSNLDSARNSTTKGHNKLSPSTILLATLEYEIPDWKIKVRIGGLGVIVSLMGIHIKDRNLVWVVPKVGGIDYPKGTREESIMITILGRDYKVKTESHILDNVKYILLEATIFYSRTPNEPYPSRMDDLESSVFYSAWNQCIAKIISRENIDLFHVNDYHCALAPLYLLPKIIPVTLSIHNGEFQGLFPLRNEIERSQICSVFNLSKKKCLEYVQYGNTFNLLFAITSYIQKHQNGIGAAGVSDKYGERCKARYPALWNLKELVSLPNPNPQDYGLDSLVSPFQFKEHVNDTNHRKSQKLEAQEWANLEKSAESTLLVFVGRWSVQKGIDLIADLAPRILEKYADVQMICVGPVIDLHGKLAALKFAAVAEMYPGRLFTQPKFTAVPKCIFEASDFVLIPSRDEPFGLVAVEFGRAGALGIGSYVGGLGSMPGWWYPIESSETQHLMNQFWNSIQLALESSHFQREAMRNQSKNQRFPVRDWLLKLDCFYSLAMENNLGTQIQKLEKAYRKEDNTPSMNEVAVSKPIKPSRTVLVRSGMPEIDTPESIQDLKTFIKNREQKSKRDSATDLWNSIRSIKSMRSLTMAWRISFFGDVIETSSAIIPSFADSSLDLTLGDKLDCADPEELLSLQQVQKWGDFTVCPFVQFEDQGSKVETYFRSQLPYISVSNSQTNLCIDENLRKGEINFFQNYRKTQSEKLALDLKKKSFLYEYCLQLAQKGTLGWPLYTIFLCLGQLLGVGAFQLAIFDDEQDFKYSQSITVGVFVLSSLFWWKVYRQFPSFVVLTVPFLIYSLSFLFLTSSLLSSGQIGIWIKQMGVWLYTFASSSGSFYFALNFGEECHSAAYIAIFRASIVEGMKQLWSSIAWYWVVQSQLNSSNMLSKVAQASFLGFMTLLCIMSFVFLFHGLPETYRSMSPSIPYFWKSLLKRKLFLWFILSETLSAFWLSGLYGRNWRFVWNQPLPFYITFTLILFFFGIVWGSILYIFSRLTREHSWFLSVFASGLASPRWAQIFWSCSAIGTSLLWASNAGAFLSLGLFLWLSVLDSIQQVGLSMMLLQTLTRIHVLGTLVLVQIFGALAYLGSRLTFIKPSDMFPNVGLWDFTEDQTRIQLWFWGILACQVVCAYGYLFLYRRDSLSRP